MTTSGIKLLFHASLTLLVGSAVLLWSSDKPASLGLLISQAEARVGRPATPMSYAGVARRTTRRAAAYGAAAGAVAAGTYYYQAAPGCRQAVNAYGQIVYHCP